MGRGGNSLQHSSSSRTHDVAVWGVLNVTPDSFSDGGKYLARDAAVEHGVSMLRDGATVLDVGGESSRPKGATYGAGATSVAVDEEIRRVVPVIELLCREHRAVVSIDTVKPEVARAAIEGGATIVNDVSCGSSRELLRVVAQANAELVLMHSRDKGQIDPTTTSYTDVVADVRRELADAVARAHAAGVSNGKIWIDPGFGFAKTWEQSLSLLANLDAFVAMGHRILSGPSRKSFLAEAVHAQGAPKPAADDRLGGTASAVAMSVLAGVHAVRVHDVAVMKQVVSVTQAAMRRRSGEGE